MCPVGPFTLVNFERTDHLKLFGRRFYQRQVAGLFLRFRVCRLREEVREQEKQLGFKFDFIIPAF
jgi:hypothetical protein